MSPLAMPAEEVWPHLAYVCLPRRASVWRSGWLVACYALTTRVERVAPEAALLDLGPCTDAEALAVTRNLLERLAAHGLPARAGIGPNRFLAQLAARACPSASAHRSQEASAMALALLTPATAPAFLRGVPVSALAELHPRGIVTPEIVARLQRYGLRTIGHLARLGEPALRRQFGAAGAFLAAIARGHDEQGLHPTPRPPRQRFRLRFSPPAASERVFAVLPRFASRVATSLARRRREGRELRLSVRFESGGIRHARLALRQHTGDPRLLAQEFQRLLRPLLAADGPAIEELRLTIADFALAVPEQQAFWRQRERRLRAAHLVAETLARRHGRPILLHPRLAMPAAVFVEDRYQLAPTGTEGSGARPIAPPRVADEHAVSPWQQVPQRLHWW